MTGVLKYLTVGLWILIILFWIGYLIFGIPVDVSDDVCRGNVQPLQVEIGDAIFFRRIVSGLFFLLVLPVFGLIIYGIYKKDDYSFYIGMVLTFTPLFLLLLLGLIKESNIPQNKFVLFVACVLLSFVLIKGIKEILKNRKIKKSKLHKLN